MQSRGVALQNSKLVEMCDSPSEKPTKVTQRSQNLSSSAKEDNVDNSSGACQLKKGPWTSAEDAILVEYVTTHGEGNWNAVQKYSGLSRCGKSCRLRWANHLRPDLKKGLFSPEEEKRIIELHAKMGNKWARMATELPGRTDNEIKNFWNTRIKKLQRAGLPIYPPDIRARAMSESLQCQENPYEKSAGSNGLSDTSDINHFDIPVFDAKKLGRAQRYLNPPSFLNLPGRSLLYKRPRETETTYPTTIGYPPFDWYDGFHDGNYDQSFWSPTYDLRIDVPSPVGMVSGSHAFINGNSPSSEPISAVMKMELPSLQLSASQVGRWAPSSPLPSLESADLIQSPLSDQTQSNCPSPRSCGLLNAVVYESHLKKSKNNSHPISPPSQSAASVLIEYNTPLSRNSSDEPQSAETIHGLKDKTEIGYSVSANSPSLLQDLRPDIQLESSWLEFPGSAKEYSITDTDDILSLYMDEFSNDYAQAGSLSTASNQSNFPGSSQWETSDIFQFSDHI